jgi:hypothetical protein
VEPDRPVNYTYRHAGHALFLQCVDDVHLRGDVVFGFTEDQFDIDVFGRLRAPASQ